jgi:hypothetical protein
MELGSVRGAYRPSVAAGSILCTAFAPSESPCPAWHVAEAGATRSRPTGWYAASSRMWNHDLVRPVQPNVKRVTVVLVAAAWATLLLVLVGCGGAGTTERPLQRVHFVAREGPTMGVCQVGKSCERPYRGRFDLITADGHRQAMTTDTRGRAVLDIPAGTYRVTTARAHPLPRLTSAIVAGRSIRAVNGRFVLEVRAVRTQTVTLLFDTGIR